jgi:type IV pilus assembly protein PilN
MAVKKVLSIEIGITYTNVCEIDYGSKSPKVYRCITFATPEHTVEDGYIRDKERFIDRLRIELQNAGMHSTHVVFTVASTKITSREVIIPGVKENRIKDVVQANLTEYFPMNLEDYTVTYNVLEKKTAPEGRQIRLLVLAAPNNLIKNYYSVAEMMGLTIMAIDYIGNSTFQIVKKQTAAGVQMVLQINEQSSIIYVLEDSVLLLQRTIPYGIDNLIASIIDSSSYSATNTLEALALLQKDHILNGQLKLEIDMSETATTYVGSEDLYKRQMQELQSKEEATSTLGYLINNVIRVQEYCLAKFKEKKINTIYITGLGAKVRGINKLISNETGIDVKKFDRLIGVNFTEREKTFEENIYISSIGAVIKPLDIVPEDVLAQKERKSMQTSILFVVLAAIVSVMFVSVSYIQSRNSKNELEALREKEEKLSEIEVLNSQYLLAKQQYNAMEALYQSLPTKNSALVTILEEIEKVIPKNIEITSISSINDELSLGIVANSKEEIAQFIMDTKKFSEISSILVGVIVENKDDNGIVKWNTTLTCTYADIQVEE